MEGLVNYSSEDEQDEKNYKSAAERGTHLRRTPPTHAAEQMRRRGGGGGNGVGSSSAAPCANTSGGGRSYKEEARYTPTTSAYTSKRSNSQSRSSRENRAEPRDSRDHRDTRENRDFKDSTTKEHRDTRDFSNGNKNDYKNERFNRSKEYDNRDRDHRRDDSFRDHRRPRDDDRNQRGGGGGGNYYNNNNSHRNFSQHKDNRYGNNNRYNNDSFTPRRHQRFHDDRVDSRSDRHGTAARKQRSPASHSPSPPASSASHSKRYSSNRGDEHRTRNRARSRSRSQTRSPHAHKRSPSPRLAYKPLDQARNTALDLERKLSACDPKLEREPSRAETLRHTEAVLTLPLSDTTPKPPTVIAVAPISSSGNSEPAVIQLPSYYNPSVINPNKYAEQVQKRKLIWGAKKAEDTSAKWGHAQFSQDSDGKVASKFMRLMGIKGGATPTNADGTPTECDRQPVTVTDVKSREKMFSSMEQQYEVARQVTHTMRGVGLGFGSQPRPY